MSKKCYGYRTNSTNPDDAAKPSYVFPLPSDQSVPCPSSSDGDVACCRPGDKCLSNNICEFVDYTPPGYPSSYYMGACTDPSFTAEECPLICTTQVRPGVVYLSNSEQWACCGTESDGESFACNSPTSITFSAPEPNKLTSYGVAGVDSGKEKSLSTGAIAGIGAGAGVGGLVLLAILVWLLLRCKKKRRARSEAKAWLAGGKPAGSYENPRVGVVPDVVAVDESPKNEYQAEEMLPMYSDGRYANNMSQHTHPNVAELGGRETTSLMNQRAELEAYR